MAIDKLVLSPNYHETPGYIGTTQGPEIGMSDFGPEYGPGAPQIRIGETIYTAYRDEQNRWRLDIPSFDERGVDFGALPNASAQQVGSWAALQQAQQNADIQNYYGYDKPASVLDEAEYWNTPESAQQNALKDQRGAAEAARQAASDDDDGFGGILQMALPIALAAFGVPALAGVMGGGTIGAIGAGSLIGLGSSLISGGNPLKGALLGAAGGFLGAQFGAADTGGALGAEEFSGLPDGDFSASGVGGASVMPGDTARAGDFVNPGDVAGVSTDPRRMLLADSGQTMADVSGGMGPFDPGGLRATVNESGAIDFARSAPLGVEELAGGAFDPGISKAVMDANSGGPSWMPAWLKNGVELANKNPGAARLAGGLVSGGMQVVGGIGSAMLNKSAMSDKIASDEKLLERRAALEAQSADKRGKSYFDANLGFAPSGQVLRRPDGTLVFSGSRLVTSRMGG